MHVLLNLPFPSWASALTALGWLYCVWAVSWPRLFYSDILPHTHREYLGYRLGRTIYWQLPRRSDWLIAACSLLPWLAFFIEPRLPAHIFLGFATTAFSMMWLTQPPGQRLGIIERPPMIFELRRTRNLFRASAIFILLGIIPAVLIGVVVHLLVSG